MTILKRILLAIVSVLAAVAVVTAGASAYRHWTLTSNSTRPQGPRYAPFAEAGRIADPAVTESSGIAASRRKPGAYWTHNDSGSKPHLFAVDERGRSLATFAVPGIKAFDWEDIALGPGPERGVSYIYIGDIGDNLARRKEIVVYRVREPAIPDTPGSSRIPTSPAATIRLTYPDGPHDSEALLVHPRTGDLYVVAKTSDATAPVFAARAPFRDGARVPMERVGALTISSLFGSLITGGDIAPDGTRVVVCNYLSAYELTLRRGDSFDSIWKHEPAIVPTPARPQGEAICYSASGDAVLMTSEGARSPLWVARRRSR
jgi:hypothetical protein